MVSRSLHGHRAGLLRRASSGSGLLSRRLLACLLAVHRYCASANTAVNFVVGGLFCMYACMCVSAQRWFADGKRYALDCEVCDRINARRCVLYLQLRDRGLVTACAYMLELVLSALLFKLQCSCVNPVCSGFETGTESLQELLCRPLALQLAPQLIYPHHGANAAPIQYSSCGNRSAEAVRVISQHASRVTSCLRP